MERTAQCHCGALKVIVSGDPERVYACHCKACQRRTGTVLHYGTSYPKDRVRIEGEHKLYERDADSGFKIRFHFCPNCGSNVFWEADRNPGNYGVAGGCFADPQFPAPQYSAWEESMHGWLALPSVGNHYPKGRPTA